MSHLAGDTLGGRKFNYALHHAARFPLIGRVAQLQNVLSLQKRHDMRLSRRLPTPPLHIRSRNLMIQKFQSKEQRGEERLALSARGAPPRCKRNLSAGCRRSLIPTAAQDFGRWRIKNANRLILSAREKKKKRKIVEFNQTAASCYSSTPP